MQSRSPEILLPGREDQADFKLHVPDQTITMSLGKALHLLLHVKDSVFRQAIQSSTATQDPVSRALRSLESILQQERQGPMDVFDSLMDKILKRDEAALRLGRYLISNVGRFTRYVIAEQLESASDKRQKLVAVLLLANDQTVNEETAASIPALAKTVEDHGAQQPTLIACAAWEALLIQSRHSHASWCHVRRVLNIIRKWRPSTDAVEKAAWRYLVEMKDDSLLRLCWSAFNTVMQPKRLVSNKPLSVKKRIEMLLDPHTDTGFPLVLAALSQKGQWLDRVSPDEESAVDRCATALAGSGAHEHDILSHLLLYTSIWKPKTPLPIPIVSSCIRISISDTSVMDRMIPHVLSNCSAAVACLVSDLDSNPAILDTLKVLLGRVGDKGAEFSTILVELLLPRIRESDMVCRALIECMNMADMDLPGLILRLIRMAYTQDSRTNQVCKALIGKALLAERWSENANGVLLYIDMIRTLKSRKGLYEDWFDHDVPSPAHIQQRKMMCVVEMNESRIAEFSLDMLSALQLWSMKATRTGLEHGMMQLIRKSYASPGDATFISAWKHLAITMSHHPESIWVILDHCTRIMTSQSWLLKGKQKDQGSITESLVFARVSPMLVLQTFPPGTYDIIRLPNDVKWDDNILKDKNKSVKWDDGQESQQCKRISKEAYNELYIRATRLDEYKQIQELAQTLIVKIFCK